jgi:DNA mismatch repair protein MutS
MMKQYEALKSEHRDKILFFRLGDFYEMFYDDALVASRVLQLTLTGRGQDDHRMPMCGIPYHAATNYIAKLIGKGFKVAICEQVEDPKEAKGLVKREVVRIYTPGTAMEDNLLDSRQSNYLVAVSAGDEGYGIAQIDTSTGAFSATQVETIEALIDEVFRLAPKEVLLPDLLPKGTAELKEALTINNVFFSQYKDNLDTEEAENLIKKNLKVSSLMSFGLDVVPEAVTAVAAIFNYLKETRVESYSQISGIKVYYPQEFLFLDAASRRNLELTETMRDRSSKGSLLSILDQTRTPMGSRLIKHYLLQPLKSMPEINERLDSVEELTANFKLRKELSGLLDQIFDLERIIGRVGSGLAKAADLIALKETLQVLPMIKTKSSECRQKLNCELTMLDDFTELKGLIDKAIVDEPPQTLKDGGLIKPGFDAEVDEIKKASGEGKDWIAALEFEERKRSGIKSLKVGYTKVFGYYIEISNSNLTAVPANYIRKQTLVNAERFITPELKDKEAQVLGAQERLKELEYEVFCRVRDQAAKLISPLQKAAALIARLDVLIAFAEIAQSNNYCRPEITNDGIYSIVDSRHPVVELTVGAHQFSSNNVEMDPVNNRFLLITGPNMAGKSTYMRQVALIIIMAQMGAYVPAKSAKISVTDRIFTRIGALDDLYAGQSTFMVEMTETANILHNATEKSLVILDEIGRGTATFDGMAIAASVAEYLHTKIKAKTLFATHYHEITILAKNHPGMKNLNVLVKEENDNIVFLHKLAAGAADRSYGIQVAKLAGLPEQVTNRAKEIYSELEMVENNLGGKL